MRRGFGRGTLLAAAGAAAFPVAAQAQENRFDLSARVVETYETNVLRLRDERVSAPRDNLSLTPQLVVDYQRLFGRQRVYLNGTAGYVFNDRYRFLNREDLSFTGGAGLRFGARCQVNPQASLFRAQSDLDDLGALVSNTATIQDYTVEASCPREVGFYPVVAAGYFRVDNSEIRRQRDQSVVDGRAGIVYRRPSLGEVELFGQFIGISRNRRLPSEEGIVRDESDVTTIGLRLGRDVGTRVSASASIGYTSVDPKAPGIPGFSGLTYRGAVTYEPSPRLSFTAGFGRAVSARGNVGTSYFLTDTADLSARARLSARTTVGAGVALSRRDFRGEDQSFQFGPRGADRQFNARASVGYALSRPVSLDLSVRYRDRDADNDFYDFSSFAATLGASLRL